MKLLLENWRQYINERKTDEIYMALVDLFVDAYSNDSNFEYASDEEEIEYEGEKIDFAALNAKFADFFARSNVYKTNDALTEYEFYLLEPRKPEIVQKIAKVDPEQQVYPSETDSEGKLLPNMLIKFDPDGPRGSWDPNEKEIFLNLHGIMDEESYRKILISNESVREFMRNSEFRSLLRQVFEHELTHYINSIRSGSKAIPMAKDYWKSKRGRQMINYFKQKFPNFSEADAEDVKSQISYINSTEEVQARLIPVFNQIKKAIQPGAQGGGASHDSIRKELEKDSPDAREIVKYTKRIYDSYFPYFWNLTVDPVKKKTLQRIYQFAQQLIEARI